MSYGNVVYFTATTPCYLMASMIKKQVRKFGCESVEQRSANFWKFAFSYHMYCCLLSNTLLWAIISDTDDGPNNIAREINSQSELYPLTYPEIAQTVCPVTALSSNQLSSDQSDTRLSLSPLSQFDPPHNNIRFRCAWSVCYSTRCHSQPGELHFCCLGIRYYP